MDNFLKEKGTALYFATCMTIFLFCTFVGSEQNQFIDFPHITMNVLPLNIVLGITAIFLLCLLFVKNTVLDFLSLLLLFRLALHCVPLLYSEIPSRFALNLTISLLCVASYLISINLGKNEKFLIKTFTCFFIFLCFQIVVEAYLGTESYFSNTYFYKHDMALPIGASNALASKIIPFFALLFVYVEKKWAKLFYVVIALFAVAMTKSRGGLVDLLLIVGIASIWEGRFSIKLLLETMVFSIGLALLSNYFFNYTDIGRFVFSDSDSTVLGRFDLWNAGLNVFLDHPIFGNGFYYFDIAMHPHNWILDVLMRSGLVGATLVVVVVIYLFHGIKDFLMDAIVRGCFLALLGMLWQGMVEIVLFSQVHDIMMWCIIGLMMSRVDKLKQNTVVYYG